ncbi:hypothetical protein [Plasmodium yoelii yoelii]|uniref:Uncharacterized protein n=1 Tax=Plasmodium yoelii yoelii TaxID=73239 RepID=Q7RHI0_PLAYO|nr:hypothetical protein [Plasmodium yoelii yoelii]
MLRICLLGNNFCIIFILFLCCGSGLCLCNPYSANM